MSISLQAAENNIRHLVSHSYERGCSSPFGRLFERWIRRDRRFEMDTAILRQTSRWRRSKVSSFVPTPSPVARHGSGARQGAPLYRPPWAREVGHLPLDNIPRTYLHPPDIYTPDIYLSLAGHLPLPSGSVNSASITAIRRSRRTNQKQT